MDKVTVASNPLRLKVGVALIVLLTSASWPFVVAIGPTDTSERHVTVIVRERLPLTGDAEELIEQVGGRISQQLPIIGGFAAELPAGAVASVRGAPSIAGLWLDGVVQMADLDDLDEYDDLPPAPGWREAIGLLDDDDDGYSGEDVTVAILDSGVSRVDDLGDRVLARVDFTPDQDGFDRFGHGTHMAGIIAGDGEASDERWMGVAPEANIVSVKVASWNGATDVSVVLAGLQWVINHREQYDIRVLNLSFGTDATQSYLIDPLNDAIEQVWASGVFVVVSAGNRGPQAGTVSKPGDDPFVMTVGASDGRGTADPGDDTVASFSARGPSADGVAKPDLIAPGVSIVSSRVADSFADRTRPAARVDDAYFKGTGTSQAAAIVSGVAALLFEANPDLTPSAAKATLMGTASGFDHLSGAGAGQVDVAAAVSATLRGSFAGAPANAHLLRSDGSGSLDASRGSHHPYADLDGNGTAEPVSGEIDVLGHPWAGPTVVGVWPASPWYPLVTVTSGWDRLAWTGPTWRGMGWNTQSWETQSWETQSWETQSWETQSWEIRLWAAATWN